MSSSCSSYSSSSSSSSPCGACKFLRRKCVKGCVFAPYFSHEQGATHFGAIHKVFGASNVSKLLSHLPIADRCEAAVTIAYEAQARVHDPIYGCVSHIFALQQQVMYLQAQLASLKEQAAAAAQNPNNIFHPAVEPMHDVVQSGCFPQNDHQGTNMPPFDANLIGNVMMNMPSTCFANDELNPSTVKYEDPGIQEENSVGNMDSSNYRQWEFGVGDDDDHADDLQSVALRYIRRNS